MKLLLFHAKKLSVECGWSNAKEARRMAKRYPGLETFTETEHKTQDLILVFATIERGDQFLQTTPIAASISEFAMRIGVEHATLCGFGHLSRNLAPMQTAIAVLKGVHTELSKVMPCEMLPFGIDKSLDLAIPLHHYNAGFREFRPTLRERITYFIQEKKGWIKLNAAYLPVTLITPLAAVSGAQLAERAGLAREHATTWVAALSALVVGLVVNCAAWVVQNRQKYEGNTNRLKADLTALIKNILKAQSITWAVTISATYALVAYGISNALAVLVQQVLDKAIFIPLYNYFNQKLAQPKNNS